ncbi:MAG: hypothetical protein NT083_12270 [Rhodocyclales bacterium]|nr:hypothetical protein [Rhodocyclales bacterium]
MKKPVAVLLVAAAIIGTVLFWLSGNIDGLIRSAIANHGSAMTLATVSVDAVKILPADGKGSINNLVIGNPAGFKTAYALKVARIDIDIDIGSVAADVIVIRRIAIHAPDVIYEKADSTTNFDVLQKNIAAYLGPAGSRKGGSKLIIQELSIRDATAQASAAFMNGKTVSVALPDISLRNLGKATGGISPGELGQEVAGALKAKLSGAVSFERLMNSAGEALGKAGAAVRGLFK